MSAQRYLVPSLVLAVVMAGCASVPSDFKPRCRTSLKLEQTTWCLADAPGPGPVLIRYDPGEDELRSEALIPDLHVVPTMLETLAYGFGSLWLSYTDFPMGVLRIDPDTLAIQARIPISSKPLGRASKGQIAVGELAVWAISEGVLYRIDPISNTAQATRNTFGLDIAAGSGVIWVAGLQDVMKIDEQTLDILEVILVPDGTHISTRMSWGWLSPGLEISGDRVLVPMARTRTGFLSYLTCAGNCPPDFTGVLDIETGSIDVDPAAARD